MVEVELSNCKRIFNLDSKTKASLKEKLTFENPAYYSVMKFSRWGSTKVPKYLKYFNESYDCLEVPVGCKLNFEYTVTKDSRLETNVEFPAFKLFLRDMQKQAVDGFLSSYSKTQEPCGTIILPTGGGKTITGIYLASQLKQRALIVVNKDDLITGWEKDIKQCFGDSIEVGLVKGKSFIIGEQFTLTTIQTLSRLGEVKLKQLYNSCSMIICDETHRVGAKSYQVLLGFPAKFRLGLTATKMRNDGLVDVIDLMCGPTVFNGTNVATEDIIPPDKIFIQRKDSSVRWVYNPKFYYTRSKRDVGDITTKEGEVLKRNSLEWLHECRRLKAMGMIEELPPRIGEAFTTIAEDENFNDMVCADIRRQYSFGKSCVVFCKTIEQVTKLYNKLIKTCPKIQCFYGGSGDKAEILAKAESKEVLITIATISIACEGTNVKAWERGFLVSSIANEKDLIQILGRLRRTTEGKKNVYFYDYRHPYVPFINRHGARRDEWYRNLKIMS